MAGYQTTYSAGMSKMEMAPGNHDPASETSGEWDPATDPDTGHVPAADKPIDDRVPWDVPVHPEDPAAEGEPLPDPPAGDTGATLGVPGKETPRHTRKPAREGDRRMSDNTADSIQPLADEIVALCKTPAYDDMSWAEIDRALQLASHQVKVVFMVHGTLNPSPGDNIEGQAASTTHKRKRGIFS